MGKNRSIIRQKKKQKHMRSTAYTPDCVCKSTRFCRTKKILRQTNSLSSERLEFLGGENLGDIDIFGETGENRRKVRRIIEKRVCQSLYRGSRAASRNNNYGRYNEKRRVANSIKNIYGGYPAAGSYAA